MSMTVKLRELAWWPTVLVLLLVIYAPGLDNTLVFDDSALGDGGLFKDYGDISRVQVRMLSYGSFVWLQQLFGTGWWRQRILNIALHIGVVVALWGFYSQLLRAVVLPKDAGPEAVSYHRSPALPLAIAFFALNPVAVYAVAYLVQRSILMATFFVVVGLWCFALGLASHRRSWHLLAVGSYMLAVLSKEHALLAPLAALPVYILMARPSPRSLGLGLVGAGLLAGLAGLGFWLKYGEIIGQPFDELSHLYLSQLAALGPEVEKHAYPLSVLNQTYAFFAYGLRWFLPYSGWLAIDMRPPFPVSLAAFPQVLGALGYVVAVAGGGFLVVRHRDWRALVGVSVLIPALLFATEFATVWVQDPFVLYRSYLWAIGVPGLIVLLFHGLSGRATLAVGVLLGAFLVWQSADRVMSLKTVESTWTDAIAKLPSDKQAVGRWRPYLVRGNAYLARGMTDEAMKDYLASAGLGDAGMGLFNMGTTHYLEGNYQTALTAMGKAVEYGYDHAKIHYQLGSTLHALGRLPEAGERFDRALAKAPNDILRADILVGKGKVDFGLNRKPDAIREFEEALKLNPEQSEAKLNLGMAWVSIREYERAVTLMGELLAREPAALPYFGRAVANLGLKKPEQARADIEMALRFEPDNPRFRDLQAQLSPARR
jgi:protein O-mannosyl-transferase